MKTLLKWFLLLLLPVALHAEKRVGLVIGCGNYGSANALPNPVKDAALVAAKLRKLQFNVVESYTDVNSREFNRKLEQFKNEAQGADVALFYFAGHGIEVEDVNYLLPIDAMLEEEADLKQEAIALPEVLKLLTEAQVKAKLVILDCCRNNPFASSSKQRGWMRTRAFKDDGGLADVKGELPQGTIIMLAAEPGKKAKDGPPGGDSPLAVALDECMGLPAKDGSGSLDVFHTMTAISKAVSKATDGAQNPWLKFDGHPELMEELAFASFAEPKSEPRKGESPNNESPTMAKNALNHVFRPTFVSVDMQLALEQLQRRRGVSATSKEDTEPRKKLLDELVGWVHTKCSELGLPVVLDKSSLGLSKTPFVVFAGDAVQDFTPAVTSGGGPNTATGSGAQKIALVDIRQVFAGYEKAKVASVSLGQSLTDSKAETNQYYDTYKKLYDETQALDKARKDPTLSVVARNWNEDAYKKKLEELRQAEKEVNAVKDRRQAGIDLQQHSQAQQLYEDIAAAVRARALAWGYDLVLDKSDVGLGGVPFLVSSGSGLTDWTEEIIGDLNRGRVSSLGNSMKASGATVSVVDLRRAFAGYGKAKQASDVLMAHVAQAKAEIRERMASYQTLLNETQALDKARSDPTVSAPYRADMEKQFRSKAAELKTSEDEITAFKNRRQNEVDEEQRQRAKELYDQIIAMIQSSFPMGAHEILLDESGTSPQGMPLVGHVPGDVRDLTDALLEKLNGNR